MATARSYDGLIRDLYVSAARGPLRVALGQGGYPPYLAAGDVAILDRHGAEAARPGEFLGLKGENGEVRLVRLLERQGSRMRVLSPARIETIGADHVLGRATEVERGGVRRPLDAAASRARLGLELLGSRARRAGRQLGMRSALSALYWGIVDGFEHGISETGDILITDRCTVGCRFCIYSCVAAGQEMDEEMAGAAARAFRDAGVPALRILGGEPFLNVPHLLRCFQAMRESYAAEDIIILTSGYFGRSAETVQAKMDPLVAAGFRRLHLSFDAFHLERYPVSCYERVLEYAREHALRSVLVVHYSVGLNADLDVLLDLRRRYPFQVRITMVSREGDAALLSESETSVAGYGDFRTRLLGEPGIELVEEDRSCFRWTVFPAGNVHFCCKQNQENRVGSLKRQGFPELQERLRGLVSRNRLNVLRFAASPKDEVTGNACLSCPLEAHAEAP